jgi:Xaa-Pro aminopeptidase
VFEAGMAIGIESFLSSEDGGSAGFEQNLIITDTGTELLTKTPMIWWD